MKKRIIITKLRKRPVSTNHLTGRISKNSKKTVSYYKVFGVLTVVIILIVILIRLIYSSTESVKSIVSASQYKILQIRENRNIKNLSQTSTVDISEHTYTQAELVAKIGKQVVLPAEAVSMVVKVKNADSLRSQGEMYKDIKNGDYIIIYPQLAVIYDANTDQVIKYVSLR